MPPRRTRIAVEVEGVPRALFSILEKSNGELIMPLTSAPRYGRHGGEWDDAPNVLEQRISIHPSSNSSTYTTIKRTTNLSDNRSLTSVALTDAVKERTGFSGVFTRRVEDLSGDGYAPLGRVRLGDRILWVPEFDRKRYTLFFAVYVGHPKMEFNINDRDAMLLIEPIAFKEFQIITMFWLEPMPSHYTSEIAYNVTHDPQTPSEPNITSSSFMSGSSPTDCVKLFRNSITALTARLLKIVGNETTNPQTLEWIKMRLDQLPKQEITRLKFANDQQSTYIVAPSNKL